MIARAEAELVSSLFEYIRPFRGRIHPVLPSEGDQRDLQAIAGLREPEDDRDPSACPTMPNSPPRRCRAQGRPGVRITEGIREQIVDLIEAAFCRARIARYVGYMACQFP